MFQRLCSELQQPLEPSDIRAHALPHTRDLAGAPSAAHTQPMPCSEAGHAHGFTHTRFTDSLCSGFHTGTCKDTQHTQ